MKPKETEVSPRESIDKMVSHLVKHRTEILDRFAEAYIAETGLMPSECELIEQRFPDRVAYYIRRREVLQPDAQETAEVERLKEEK